MKDKHNNDKNDKDKKGKKSHDAEGGDGVKRGRKPKKWIAEPTWFRLDKLALSGLNYLQAKCPEKNRGEVVSDAIKINAGMMLLAAPKKYNRIDPTDLMLILGGISNTKLILERFRSDVIKSIITQDEKLALIKRAETTLDNVDLIINKIELLCCENKDQKDG